MADTGAVMQGTKQPVDSGILSDSALELAGAVSTLVQGVEHLRHRIAESEGLSRTEFRAIARVGEFRQLTPKALAQSLELTNGAVTAVTDRLVASRLMERVPHPDDRRSVLLQLTPLGGQIISRISDVYRAAIADATSTESSRMMSQIDGFLRRLGCGLRDARIPDAPVPDSHA